MGSYEWAGRSIERHRAQIREQLGFRECSVADAEQLTAWLVEHVVERERRPERVHEELLARCGAERIEPPAAGRVDRVVRSALRTGEATLSALVASRLGDESKARIAALVAGEDAEDPIGPAAADVDDDRDRPLLGKLKQAPGNVSLETMLTEIDKLRAVRAIGVSPGAFGDVAPSVVAEWRARAAVQSPSHLRAHPEALRVTLVAALLREREREITDTLVDLLISTVHRIGARAEKKVTSELVNAFKRVHGKENILFAVAEAALGAPDGTVRGVVFPAVAGDEQTLRELVHEFKANGPLYRRTVQTTLKASYTNHSSSAHQPIIEALGLIGRFAGAGNITYYPLGEVIPLHRGLRGDWDDVLYREDARGRRRVVRMV